MTTVGIGICTMQIFFSFFSSVGQLVRLLVHLQLEQLVLQELEVVGAAHHQLHLSPLPVTEARVQPQR